MYNQTVIGIGCFAKPEKLSRIFNKLVQNYALGSVVDNQFLDQSMAAECHGADLLRALMARPTSERQSGRGKTVRLSEHRTITGFYLSLFDRKLNLTIFARGNSSRQEIYTAKLDVLTRLRQERLN